MARLRAITFAVAALATVTPAVSGTTVADAAVADTTTRLGGGDRYATAVAVSAHLFAAGADRIYLATGDAYPDALAGGALAGAWQAPLLLVQTSAIPVSTAQEIRRLDPVEIVVLGGPGAVSDGVVTELQDLSRAEVVRIAGANRYATAAAIADAFPAGTDDVFVATGAGYADAVAAASTATSQKSPIVLVATDSVPQVSRAALERLSPRRAVVLGGTASISDTVVSELSSIAEQVTRVSGPDRFTTATALSRAAFPGGATTVLLANASTFADALAAAPIPSVAGAAPLLLTKSLCLPEAVETELARLAPTEVIVLGGENAVSDVAAGGAVCRPTFPPGASYLTKDPSAGPRFTAQRWDPCSPVRVRLNANAAPAGAESVVREAVEHLGVVSGIPFEYVGATTTPWSPSWSDHGEDSPPEWDLGEGADIWVGWTPEPFGQMVPADAPAHFGVRSVIVERGVRVEDAWIAFNPVKARPIEFRGGYRSGWGWGTWLLLELGYVAGVEFAGENVPEIMHYPVYNRSDFPAYYGPLDRAALAANGAIRGCLPAEYPVVAR